MGDELINFRKIEHIDIVLKKNPLFSHKCEDIYSSIKLVHQALPRIDLEDVELETKFLKYRLKAPIIITGMTGGHSITREINEKIAVTAYRYGLAMGVGSQRPMIVHRGDGEVLETYRVVKKTAPETPLIGNIGANTLLDLSVDDVEWLVKSIDADALAIHLNPAQEVIQPEGDTRFNEKILNKIEELIDRLDIPIIVKEVGHGLSMETVSLLASTGIRYYDVAGACGTNWALVEMYREKTPEIKRVIAAQLSDWGIPTPLSLIEAKYTSPDSYIIASGGVWDGLKAVKNIVLGADLVGLARPVIKKLIEEGLDGLNRYLEEYIETIKSILFLIGARSLEEARRKPVVLLDPVKTYLEQRGIDVERYVKYIRLRGS